MRRLTFLLSMFLLAGGIAFAQKSVDIPKVISYQGLLTSTDGNPLADGDYPITVTLYGNETGSDAVWHDTYMVAVRGGVFNIYLGSGMNPLPAPDKMNKALWVGTQMAGAEEMRPLTRLSATPYAINVPDNSITGHKIADGAVTASKVDMNYIAGVTVNGKEIVGKGTVLKIQGGKDINVDYDDATQSIVIGAPTSKGREVGGDKEGDRELQVAPFDAWALQGSGIDVLTGIISAPVMGNWIGTPAGAVPFELRTNNIPIMRYISGGAGTPNVVGGDAVNSVPGMGIGNVIAGGGVGGGGSPNTIVGEQYNTISGGTGNRIDNQFSMYDVIAGGQSHTIGTAAQPANFGAIGGGSFNNIFGDFGTIAGGTGNLVQTIFGTIGGGQGNQAAGPFSAVVGGQNNFVGLNNSFIGGGFNNQIQAPWAVIAGGENNTVFGPHGAIGGGFFNQVNGPWSVVAGGSNNLVFANNGAIGGGMGNQILGPFSTVAGGTGNFVQGGFDAVGGGLGNNIGPFDQSTIGGGANNGVQGPQSTIGGGEANFINIDHGTIGGGWNNVVNGQVGTVGGGEQNQANGERSTVGGGIGNNIGPNGARSVIAGGEFNQITADRSAIGGGSNNRIFGTRGVISGGENNVINGPFNNSAIVGGFGNMTSAAYTFTGGGMGNINDGMESVIGGGTFNNIQLGSTRGFIGGGNNNRILANAGNGVAAAIPGGDNLTAQSYGQTVIGFNNAPKGNVPPGGPLNNDPLFVIGNGTAAFPRNGFEVSYNGHSRVYGNLPVGQPSRFGATYTNNVIYAWGEVNAVGAIGCNFAANSQRLGVGWYRITIQTANQDGGPTNLLCGSITATLNTNGNPGPPLVACRSIRTTRLVNNQFDVYITQNVLVAGPALNCVSVDDNFDFKVTATAPPYP